MRKTAKKIFSLVAAATLVTSTLAMTACGDEYFKAANTVEYTGNAELNGLDNGGFAVEKDGYVYFINGKEAYTADNTYGDVVKGALMRIKTSDLNAGAYDKATTVIPMLFVAQNFNAGIFIYGDYVYYATPTTSKNMHGEVTNTYIDFKSAKLDGTETMKNYYFRLPNNNANYRFVEAGEGDDKAVYCLYEEDGALKSYNTETGDTNVLVKGGTYAFDKDNLSNPNVYYTMNVPYNVDSDVPASGVSYNQVYCVNAAATAKANASEASYTVEGGRTYKFDKTWMEAENDEAKAAAKKDGKKYEATYDFDDYSTYPYVNLGSLVLNGVGKNQADYEDTRFNDKQGEKVKAEDCQEFTGYTYTISGYDNGGIYYTKANDTKLYYLPEAHGAASAIAANAKADVVTAELSTDLQSKALFEYNATTKTHTYLYIESDKIKKGSMTAGEETDAITLCKAPANATLWKTVDDVLYYYAAGTHPVTSAATTGMQLSRIVYTGADEVYQNLPSLVADKKYQPVTITYVDFASPDAWYKPEIYGNTLLFANAEPINGSSYNYVYATSLELNTITANNEKYEKAYEEMDMTEKDTVKKAMTYYFRTGDADLIKELADAELYTNNGDKSEYAVFQAYVNGNYGTEKDFIGLVGAVNKADQEAIKEDWRATLPAETEEVEEEGGLETWAICLIVAAAVVVVAVAIAVPVVIVNKNKAAKAEAEATVNAYKRKKIDTTDDKTIDVYADEETEEAQAETVEEATQEAIVAEVAEEAVETVEAVEAVEETAEEPAEKTQE